MPSDFTTASQQSQHDFVQFLKNPLEKLLEGKIVSTEGNGEIGELLDIHAGIDAILIHPKFGLFGIGVRVQYGQNYRTFTIRKHRESQAKTEYAKYANAMLKGGITTMFNVQAYLDDKTARLLGVAIAKTEDIHRLIDHGLCRVQITGNDQIGRATFYVVEWDIFNNNNLGSMWLAEFNGKETEALCQ